MEVENAAREMLTPTTRVQKLTVSSDRVASALENHGWLKSISGERDFGNAVDAISRMFATGRGLFVTGAAGCGKTKLLLTLKEAIRGHGDAIFMYCKDPTHLSWMRNAPVLYRRSVYVDDIGTEQVVREFGNVVDVVGDFIQRYHFRGTGRFMASSNLDSSQINEKYGGRTLDRIMEMCVVLKLNGNSKRERMIYGR